MLSAAFCSTPLPQTGRSAAAGCAGGRLEHELVFMQDTLGATALPEAALTGHPQAARQTLSALGDDMSKKLILATVADSCGGYTARHLAASGGHIQVILQLPTALADEELRQELVFTRTILDGFTVLHLAARKGHAPVVSCCSG